MQRINIYLTDEQLEFINSRSMTISEIMRRSLDDYIEKTKSFNVSASKSMKGGQNG